MELAVAHIIDLPQTHLQVLQRLESVDARPRYRVESSQHQQLLLQVYSTEDWDLFERERLCLELLGRHENLLSLALAAVVPEPTQTGLLLFDSMPIGNLAKLCVQVQELSEQQVLNYAKEIAKGLVFIHSKGVTHCNLRLEDVWVGSDFRCKISGFECAEATGLPSPKTEYMRDPGILAPEAVGSHSAAIKAPVDMWAFGCLVYRLLYRDFPFDSDLQPGELVAQCKPQPKLVAQDWDYLFTRLFMIEPNSRAGAMETLDTLNSIKLEKRTILPSQLLIDSGEPSQDPPKRKSSWFGNSTKSWVKTATSENSQPPDLDCVRKLVAKAWNKPKKIGKFFTSVQKLQTSRTLVAVKSMLLLHCYLMQGPISLVQSHAEGCKMMLDKTEKYWTPTAQIRPDDHHTEYLAGLIRQFLKLLQRKVDLHIGSKSPGNWQGAQLTTGQQCNLALNFWSDMLLLASRLFVGGRDLIELRVAWMVQVLEDVLGLYSALCRTLPEVIAHLEDMSMQAFYVLKFQSNYNKLTSLVRGLTRQKPGVKLLDLPEDHPAEMQRLMTSIPTAVDVVEAPLSEGEDVSEEDWRSVSIQYPATRTIESPRSRAATDGHDSKHHKAENRLQMPIVSIPELSELEPESPHCLDRNLRQLLRASPSWLILMDELQFREVWNMGMFFTVYKGVYRKTAVSISVLRSFVQKPRFEDMVEYIDLMSRVTHPKLVLFMGASVGRQIAIVTEMCVGGSLYSLLHEKKGIHLSLRVALGVLEDVAQAIHGLHSSVPPLTHGELTSAKVILMEEPEENVEKLTAKVSECGVRMFLDPTRGLGELGYWTAPEVEEGGSVTPAADIFAFGVLMLEVLTRRVPADIEIKANQVPVQIPGNLSSLLIQCLQENPGLRPTSQMVLDVFDSIDV